MSIYDIVMLVIFLGSVIFGYRKGLAWQIASLAAIVLSYFVAINFRNPVARLISVEAPWNQFAAMLLLFLGTSLVVWTIYASTSRKIKRLELKGFDRQAGAVVGIFKGSILCMLVTVFAVSLFSSTRNMVHNSKSGYYVVMGIEQFSRFTPTELAQFLNPHLEQYRNNLGSIPVKRDIFQSSPNDPSGGFRGGFQGGFQSSQPQQNQQIGFSNQGFQNQNQSQNQSQFQNFNQNRFQTQNQNSNNGFSNQSPYGQRNQFQRQSQPTQQDSGEFWQPQPNQNPNNDQFQRSTVTQGANGWPQINSTIDTKELLQRGASTTADLLRRAYESANEPR